MSDIDLQIEPLDDGQLLRPIGDIDLSRSPALRSRLAAVTKEPAGRLVIDLSGVPYMDSSGVATLVEALQVTRRNGTELILCALQERVRSIFEIARLDMVFTIVDTVAEARTA